MQQLKKKKKQQRRKQMQRSNEAVAKFYNSPAWKKTRKAYKLYRMNICERCGGLGYFVHHKKYINADNIWDTDITLNFENLELLCKDCHNKEHFEENFFDSDGQLIPPVDEKFKALGISV